MKIDKKPFIKKDAGNVEYNAQVFNNSTALAEDQEEITLEELVDSIKISGPAYRGARMPEFNPNAINISEIPDNMRLKEYDKEVDGDTVKLYWVTQEPFTKEDVQVFLKEIKRAFSNAVETNKFKSPFTVKLSVICRDGREKGYAHKIFTVDSHVNENWRDENFTKEDLRRYIDSIDDKVDIIEYSLKGMAGKHPEFSTDIISEIKSISNRFNLLQYNLSVQDQNKE